MADGRGTYDAQGLYRPTIDDTPGRPPSAPAEVWERVRQDYLAGMSAPEASRVHGVGLSTLRGRAAREGWRRTDQPWTRRREDEPDEGTELEDRVYGDLDRIEYRELSFVADRRMMRAVLRGDATAAMRWRRIRDAMTSDEETIARLIEEDAAIDVRIALARAGDADHGDDRDDRDGGFSGPA